MLGVFLPERCLHCDRATVRSETGGKEWVHRYLCPVCYRILESADEPEERDVRDQFYRVASGIALRHTRAAYTFLAESPVQSLVHAMKYSGMPRLAKYFGRSIATLVPQPAEMIVPVPLHRTRLAERGYNQAEALAHGVARSVAANVVPAVKRIRPTPSQTSLSITERIENVRGAFALTRDSARVTGKHVLLVDDVMTTGATLSSVAETLHDARPKSISVLTLAAAML